MQRTIYIEVEAHKVEPIVRGNTEWPFYRQVWDFSTTTTIPEFLLSDLTRCEFRRAEHCKMLAECLWDANGYNCARAIFTYEATGEQYMATYNKFVDGSIETTFSLYSPATSLQESQENYPLVG